MNQIERATGHCAIGSLGVFFGSMGLGSMGWTYELMNYLTLAGLLGMILSLIAYGLAYQVAEHLHIPHAERQQSAR